MSATELMLLSVCLEGRCWVCVNEMFIVWRVMQGAPLVVLNSFGGEEHLKLATVLFQNLFPAINVHTTSLKSCKVTLSFNILWP